MFLTRSIRRLMTLWLVWVIIVVGLVLSFSIRGLLSYRQAVKDLKYSVHQIPRKSEIVTNIGPLFETVLKAPETLRAAELRHQEFVIRLEAITASTQEYLRKLSELPQDPKLTAQSHLIYPILSSVDGHLRRLEMLESQLARDPEDSRIVHGMLLELAATQARVNELPDPRTKLNVILKEAEADYALHFWLVSGSGISALLLLAGLFFFGRHRIVIPIRKLHQGACRMAQQEYDYRLPPAKSIEMQELTDALNTMNARFQENEADLNHQVQLRSQLLVRSERLADVGILSAGVAHEINNPLSAITMAADSLQERIAMTEGELTDADRQIALDYLEMMQTEASRCQSITTQLLDFSRAAESSRSLHDLTVIVQDVVALVRHMSKFQDREIRFDPERSCLIEINGAEIKQVVLNLVLNGLEAMDSGGTMRLKLIEQTDTVLLSVADDGIGMTEETQQQIFDPFFTQRRSGKGTGLGLSITHRIITDHGGTICPSSEGPGQGTTFQVTLPRVAAKTSGRIEAA